MAVERPTLLLDLAGVLLDYAPERRLSLIASMSGLEVATVKARIEADGITDRLDTGQTDENGLVCFLASLCGCPIDADAAWRAWLSAFSSGPAMAVLPALAARYRLGIFTNNPRAITRVFDATPFETMFFSSELGAKKPNPGTYRAVERALGLAAAAITFVDDGAANVEGAHRAGWCAIHYQSLSDLSGL